MKILIVGIIAFIAWSIPSTYYYVCYIKDLCSNDEYIEESIQISAEPEMIQEEITESTNGIIDKVEQVPEPGNYFLYHDYNEIRYIPDNQFEEYLMKLKDYAASNKQIKINITGYTDTRGSESSNRELGLKRAGLVKNHLISMGISENMIEVSSMGEMVSNDENESIKGGAKNRRTEINYQSNN